MQPDYQDPLWRKRRAGLFLWVAVLCVLIIIASLIKYLLLTPHAVTTVAFNGQSCVIEGDFELKWIHSVEKQWWVEAYALEDEHLLLTDTYLQTFGAGTPSTEALGDPTDKYPGYVHYRINTRLPYLNWMISSNIQAHIIVNPHSQQPLSLPIYDWVDDYTNIHIFASTQNLWTLRHQDLCYEHPYTAHSIDTPSQGSSAPF